LPQEWGLDARRAAAADLPAVEPWRREVDLRRDAGRPRGEGGADGVADAQPARVQSVVLVVEDDGDPDPLVDPEAVLDREGGLVVLYHEATSRGLRQALEVGDEALERRPAIAVSSAHVQDDDGLGALFHRVQQTRLHVDVGPGLRGDLLVPGVQDDVLGWVQRESHVEALRVTADT